MTCLQVIFVRNLRVLSQAWSVIGKSQILNTHAQSSWCDADGSRGKSMRKAIGLNLDRVIGVDAQRFNPAAFDPGL